MKRHHWLLIVGAFASGCSSPEMPASISETARQHQDELARRNDALMDHAEPADNQATRAAAEAIRMNALLSKLEEQAKRVDAILARAEARKP